MAADPGLQRRGAGGPVIGRGKNSRAAGPQQAAQPGQEIARRIDAVDDVERDGGAETAVAERQRHGIAGPEIDALQEEVCKTHRFKPVKYRNEILGYCSECQKDGI